MVHVSAIERLGREVEIEGRKTIYGPDNLLHALPELVQSYQNHIIAEPLLLVSEDGIPLNPAFENDRERVRTAFDGAYERLISSVGLYRSEPAREIT
jgi:hypothetical protein